MSYYSKNLSAKRLKKCYEIAPPRVQQYLQAEIDFIVSYLNINDVVLDLGCGYGRVLPFISNYVKKVVGIDNALGSIEMGKECLKDYSNIELLCMDAVCLAFEDNRFDKVVCVQNGISAFDINPLCLFKESLRVTRPGGLVMISTYSEKFWEDRLEWFTLQSDAGLLGEIDWNKTGNGMIICKDGFKASTLSKENFLSLAEELKVKCDLIEVDNSSLFAIINKKAVG